MMHILVRVVSTWIFSRCLSRAGAFSEVYVMSPLGGVQCTHQSQDLGRTHDQVREVHRYGEKLC